MALTTPLLAQALLPSEGYREFAYDDKQPWLELHPGDEDKVIGTLTYGHGLTKREDGSPVQIGDRISESESFDRVNRHIRTEVEPGLENLIHVPLTDFQYNALGHIMYQYGAGEMSDWRLIKRINAGEDWEKIVLEWINGTVMFMGEPDFWERRVKEILMFLGMDHRMAPNIPFGTDIIGAVIELGFDGNLPKPGPKHTPTRTEYSYDEELFSEPEAPKQAISDPTPETPLTTADLNAMQLESLKTGRAISITKLTPKVPLEAVAYLPEDKKQPEKVTVKRIENSRRGKGYAKQQTGKELGAIGGIGAAAGIVGAAEPVVKVVDKYPAQTLGYVFAGLMVFGIIYYAYGEWQRQRGEDEAEDLLG
jgi:GH24 family phage-related lysozyme (muramidase)